MYLSVSTFSRMRYSYGVVAMAVVVGMIAPAAAPTILGPFLLLGLLLLGLAHGACDQLVLPAYHPVRGRAWWPYLLRFVVGYLGLAAVVAVGWWQWPGASVIVFFLLTIWHWGSGDVSAQPRHPVLWALHSVLRGALVFAVPAIAWPAATLHIINSLLRFADAPMWAAAVFQAVIYALGWLVLAGHLALWVEYAVLGEASRWRTDMLEVLLLVGLFVVLPPLLALGVYFCFWHSLQHVLRLTPLLGYTAPARRRGVAWWALGREVGFFVRRSLPILLVSLAALTVLYMLLAVRLSTPDALLSLTLVVASVVTLPHVLLVSLVMDRKAAG